jgi:hypothetical protein
VRDSPNYTPFPRRIWQPILCVAAKKLGLPGRTTSGRLGCQPVDCGRPGLRPPATFTSWSFFCAAVTFRREEPGKAARARCRRNSLRRSTWRVRVSSSLTYGSGMSMVRLSPGQLRPMAARRMVRRRSIWAATWPSIPAKVAAHHQQAREDLARAAPVRPQVQAAAFPLCPFLLVARVLRLDLGQAVEAPLFHVHLVQRVAQFFSLGAIVGQEHSFPPRHRPAGRYTLPLCKSQLK